MAQPEHEPHPLGDVDRLEQLDLALGADSSGHHPTRSARPPGSSGSTRAEDAAHLAVAELLEQRDQGGAQLGAQRLGLVGGGGLDDRLGGDPQAGPGADHAGAQHGARPVARTTRAAVPPGRTPVDSTVATAPTLAKRSPIAGDEQQLAALLGGGGGRLGLVGLGADRHDHAGQDDAVGKGEGGEGVGFERLGHGASE